MQTSESRQCGATFQCSDLLITPEGLTCQNCHNQSETEIWDDRVRSAKDDFGLGLVAGLFGGCIGVAITLMVGGPKTKAGGWSGFAVHALLAILLSILWLFHRIMGSMHGG
jgi:hypothetical protein